MIRLQFSWFLLFIRNWQIISHFPHTGDTHVFHHAKRQPKRMYQWTISGLPGKVFSCNPLFVAARAHEYITVHATFLKDLWKVPVIAEAVDIITADWLHTKFLIKIPLAIKPLSHKGFPAGSVAVRLSPPATHDHPSALLHQKYFYCFWLLLLLCFYSFYILYVCPTTSLKRSALQAIWIYWILSFKVLDMVFYKSSWIIIKYCL